MQQKKYTLLSELGEFRVIEELTKQNKTRNTSTIKSVGDDAAVIKYDDGKATVVTSDMLVENIHFNLRYVPLKYLGFKAVTVNVSDIYAMNATPKQIIFSLAVSSRFTLEALQELYKGIYEACDFYGVDLVGGDTTTINQGMVISITAVGEANPDKLTYRNTAKAHELICVSGDLGAAYMGLQLLERERRVYENNPHQTPDWTGWEYILERQLKPVARKDIVEFFDKKGIKPSAMIDISDGLSSEILHICNSSGIGAEIYEEKIPIENQTAKLAEEMYLEPVVAAMNGGEDYELLFTMPLDFLEIIKQNPAISVIGRTTDKKGDINLITKDGTSIPITAQGWNAFENKNTTNE